MPQLKPHERIVVSINITNATVCFGPQITVEGSLKNVAPELVTKRVEAYNRRFEEEASLKYSVEHREGSCTFTVIGDGLLQLRGPRSGVDSADAKPSQGTHIAANMLMKLLFPHSVIVWRGVAREACKRVAWFCREQD